VTSVDLAEVVRASVAETSQLFADRTLDVEITGPLPPVAADRDRVVQVLLNLLSNAAKFSDHDRGRVTVHARVDGSAVRVDVTDNGPGIAAAEQEAIFEKFQQGGDPQTGRLGGTGLGLPISRQIIDHLGGSLWVESTPGAGATFSFTLPVAAALGMEPSWAAGS